MSATETRSFRTPPIWKGKSKAIVKVKGWKNTSNSYYICISASSDMTYRRRPHNFFLYCIFKKRKKGFLISSSAHTNILKMEKYPQHWAILVGGGQPPTFDEQGGRAPAAPPRWQRLCFLQWCCSTHWPQLFLLPALFQSLQAKPTLFQLMRNDITVICSGSRSRKSS